jgi:hypothetical protein
MLENGQQVTHSPLSYRQLPLEHLFLRMNTAFTVGQNNGVLSIKQ